MVKRTYTPGCTYIVYTKKELDEIRQNGDFLLINISYSQKKWYEFWKRRRINYYEVMCMK